MAETLEKTQTALASEVHANIAKEPHRAFDIIIYKHNLDSINQELKKQSAASCVILSEEGFKGDAPHIGHSLSPEGIVWMEKAIRAYHRNRILGVLAQIGIQPDKVVLKLWKELLTELYRDQKAPRKELYDAIIKDSRFNQATKNWLAAFCLKIH